MAKKGELRIRCGVDSEGDYFAKVEVYQGFLKGWKKVKAFWAVGMRDPAECLRNARRYVESHKRLELGVVQ